MEPKVIVIGKSIGINCSLLDSSIVDETLNTLSVDIGFLPRRGIEGSLSHMSNRCGRIFCFLPSSIIECGSFLLKIGNMLLIGLNARRAYLVFDRIRQDFVIIHLPRCWINGIHVGLAHVPFIINLNLVRLNRLVAKLGFLAGGLDTHHSSVGIQRRCCWLRGFNCEGWKRNRSHYTLPPGAG